jgi:hypothetical protein
MYLYSLGILAGVVKLSGSLVRNASWGLCHAHLHIIRLTRHTWTTKAYIASDSVGEGG